MCGIIGLITDREKKVDNFHKSLSLMTHRGPNNLTSNTYEYNDKKIYLGHARLSIIDVSSVANQPFVSDCGDYIIIYNGEIYNYLELKECYLSDDEFRTSSDTEVLLKLFIKYGLNILNSLDGMFAFAILDIKENKLVCARDQIGVKPLYIYKNENEFTFASEIRPIFELTGIKPKIDHYSMYEFLRNSFVYEPGTGFKDISKLGAGEYCVVNLENNELSRVRYWLPWDKKNNSNFTIDEKFKINDLNQELKNSINIQTRSDVPVGLFFSGGVDSTVVLSELKNKVSSITIRSKQEESVESGEINDYKYAKIIAKHFKVTLDEIELKDNSDIELFLNDIRTLAIKSEELVSDFTFIASKNLAHESKKKGFTVMLSGMGADEIFGGYPKYKLLNNRKLYCSIAVIAGFTIGRFKEFSKKIDRLKWFCEEKNYIDQYTSILGYFSKKEISEYFKYYMPAYEQNYVDKLTDHVRHIKNPVKKAMYLDIFGFLAHNFTVADKSTMDASIELRVPLATKRLYEKSFNMPVNNLIDAFKTKKPLRNFLNNKIPKYLIERKKGGFHPPIDALIRKIGKERTSQVFIKNGIDDLVDKIFTDTLLNEHYSNKKNHTYRIFQLLYLSFWYREYIK